MHFTLDSPVLLGAIRHAHALHLVALPVGERCLPACMHACMHACRYWHLTALHPPPWCA